MGRHIPRFFVDLALSENAELHLPERAAEHLSRVLRAKAGDPIIVFNGKGGEWLARLKTVNRKTVTAQIENHSAINREPARKIILAQCISRSDRMDYSVQKATELGVTAIQPLWSEGIRRFKNTEQQEKKVTHWNAIAQSAAEQSGRTRVPPVRMPEKLEDWQPTAKGYCWVMHPEGKHSLNENASCVPEGESVTLLVGSESGFTANDLARAEALGFQPLAFGPRILRTETAGPAILTALLAVWGELD